MIRLLGAFAILAAGAPATATAAPAVIEQVAREADGTSSLSHSVVVPAPAEEVWEAIATERGWTSWAVPVAWRSATRPNVIETSYNPSARPGDAMNIENEVIGRDRPRRLVFRTIKAPQGFPHLAALLKVTQTFDLSPDSAGTRVSLTGTGYSDDEAGRAMLAFFKSGNRVSLEMLHDRFAHGPVDWTEKLKKPLK